jgi:hypothetical protein
MAAFSGPNFRLQQPVTRSNINGLVIDQLALYLDTGRTLSYSGSGATWADLSGNGRNVTLYNAGNSTYTNSPAGPPSFSAARLGEFIFDGNDFGILSSDITTGADITVSAWVKTVDNARYNGIVSHCSGGPVYLRYAVYLNKMNYQYYDTQWREIVGNTNLTDGNWKNLVWAKAGTSMVMYVNAAQDSTHTLNSTVTNRPIRSIGSGWGPCDTGFGYPAGSDNYGQAYIGSIAIVMIHNKQLSATEVSRNYNSHRRRFDL